MNILCKFFWHRWVVEEAVANRLGLYCIKKTCKKCGKVKVLYE